jgi:hypothetical protein
VKINNPFSFCFVGLNIISQFKAFLSEKKRKKEKRKKNQITQRRETDKYQSIQSMNKQPNKDHHTTPKHVPIFFFF